MSKKETFFVFEDPTPTTSLHELKVGDLFIFKNEQFRKTSDLGWYYGFLNVTDSKGERCYLHPSTKIGLLN